MDNGNHIEKQKYRRRHSYLYVKEVIQPLLPHAVVTSMESSGSPNNWHKTATIGIENSNSSLYKSGYYYSGELEFIHYTSYQNLFNILNDKAIRMYDFNYLSDPQELIFSTKVINIPSTYPDKKDIKEKLFSLSMCEYNENTNPDSFDMWRLYGLTGRGIGIVLKFDDDNRKNWQNYYLSKIYYGDEFLEPLEELTIRHDAFHKEYDFEVKNSAKMLHHILGFHKHSIYRTENEVRLLKYIKNVDSWLYDNDPTIFICSNHKYQQSRYTHLELECPERNKRFDKEFEGDDETRKQEYNSFPKVRISKIILGFEFSKSNMWDITKTVNDVSEKN